MAVLLFDPMDLENGITKTHEEKMRQFCKEHEKVWCTVVAFCRVGEKPTLDWLELWTYNMSDIINILPDKEELVRKDKDKVVTRFRDFTGKYVYRCNLVRRLK